MNIDSQMCEYVVSDFVKTGCALFLQFMTALSCPGEEDNLNRLMKEGE